MKGAYKSIFIYLVVIFLFSLPLFGFGCKVTEKEVQEALGPVELVYWRAWDSQDDFGEALVKYQKLHPNISIRYKRFRYEEYEEELLNALAEDRGPDIFSIHNTWMRKYQPKLLPLPAEITLPYQYVEKTWGIKEEIKIGWKKTATISLRQLRDQFVQAVYDDVVIPSGQANAPDQIYGLPLAVDSLALFYNRSLLEAAGIPQPPKNWTEFREQVQKLTSLDQQGGIVQAGAALGMSKNIPRSSDILSLLMMQNGAEMADASGNALFDRVPAGLSGRELPPGEQALLFYTAFSQPGSELYSWNETMPDALEAFSQGRTAFFFGYAYHLPQIKNRAPKLNFGITAMPQIEGAAPTQYKNYANYWTEVVSKKTKYSNEAWDFIQFITNAENVGSYLAETKRPTALKALIKTQEDDEYLHAFSQQTLTARSWYRGQDANAMEKIFQEMIDIVVAGKATAREAIRLAVQKVNQTIRK